MRGAPHVIGALALSIAATGTAVVVLHEPSEPGRQGRLPASAPSPSYQPVAVPTASAVPSAPATPDPVVAAPTEVPTSVPSLRPPAPVVAAPPAASCPQAPAARPWTGPVNRIALDRGSDAVQQIGSADGRVWLASHARGGEERTSLVGVPTDGSAPSVIDLAMSVDDWQLDGTSLVGREANGPLRRFGTDGSALTVGWATARDGTPVALWDIAAAGGHVVGVGARGDSTLLFSFALPTLEQEWVVPLRHTVGVKGGTAFGVGTDGRDVYVVTGLGTGPTPTASRAWRFSRAGKQLAWGDFPAMTSQGSAAKLAVTPEGPLVLAGRQDVPGTTPLVRLDPRTLKVSKRWAEPGRVQQLELVDGEVWVTTLGTCGDSFVLTRRDARTLRSFAQYQLSDGTRRVTALGDTAWALRVGGAPEPLELQSFPLD